jgi:hypothetical protein
VHAHLQAVADAVARHPTQAPPEVASMAVASVVEAAERSAGEARAMARVRVEEVGSRVSREIGSRLEQFEQELDRLAGGANELRGMIAAFGEETVRAVRAEVGGQAEEVVGRMREAVRGHAPDGSHLRPPAPPGYIRPVSSAEGSVEGSMRGR